jgi:hypothetical protein
MGLSSIALYLLYRFLHFIHRTISPMQKCAFLDRFMRIGNWMLLELVVRDSLKNDCTWEQGARGVLDYRFSSFVCCHNCLFLARLLYSLISAL